MAEESVNANENRKKEVAFQDEEGRGGIEEPLLMPEAGEGKCISVVAPSNMEEGYTFEASVDGRVFVVTVPKGGVLMGETIIVNYPKEEDFLDFSANPHSIPSGYWRDGIFDVCAHGKTHPSTICSCLCPGILMSQVQTRFWNKGEGDNKCSRSLSNISPCRKVSFIVALLAIVFIVLKVLYVVRMLKFEKPPGWTQQDMDEYTREHIIDLFFSVIGTFKKVRLTVFATFVVMMIFIGFNLQLIVRTRAFIRQRYDIKPSTACNNQCDDILVSACLPCCTAAQIARHTANYNRYEAKPCTDIGLSPSAPPVLGEPSQSLSS